MKLSLSEIGTLFECKNIFPDTQINNIKIDSREVQKDDIFVAIRGENFDGHDFINEAFQNGALAVITEKDFKLNKELENKKFVFVVENSILALQKIAKFYKSKFQAKVIAITGSVGKSTVKEMLASILSQKFNIIKTQKNFNGQIGVPMTVFNLTDETQFMICEVGVSMPGEMKKLAKILMPNYVIINNIGVSHIGNFNNINNIAKEKFDILTFSEKCKLFINFDSPELINFINNNKDNLKIENCKFFGFDSECDYKAENVSLLDEKTEFIFVTKNYKALISLPYVGMHFVYNALAALSVAVELEMHIDDIKSGISNFKKLSMRQDIIKMPNFTIIDDSYNSSPDSIRAAVNIFKNIKSDGENIFVMGDILELGNYSQNIHFELGKFIAYSDIDFLITVGNETKFTCEGVKISGSKLNFKHFDNNQEVINFLCEFLQNRKSDKILVKGSRGMKTDEIIKELKNKFENNNNYEKN